MHNQLVQVEVVINFKGKTKVEAKGDNLAIEDVANNNNISIRCRQSVSPNSISLNLSRIQLQQFSRVAKVEVRVVDSKVVIVAVVKAVMDVECADSARVQGTMSEFVHGWRRLQGS